MKKTLLSLLGVLMAFPALARDITFAHEGQTLTYTVINESEKLVEVKAGTGTDAPGNEVTGELIIPSMAKDGDKEYSVTSIGGYAFSGCSGLTSVTIPNSVTSIGGYAFSGCSGLTSVTIPNSVTSIGFYAFYGCSSLTKAEFASIKSLCSIKFWSYGNPLSCAHNLYIDGKEIKEVEIPESVTSIGNYAFSGCSGLTSVTIPNSVTSIGDNAFSGCSGLTSVTIPNSVTSIGGDAFSGCSGLTSVTIPNSVTSIGNSAFNSCSSLTSVAIPNSVTSIRNSTFNSCSSLTSITIPNSVTSIGYSAFYACRSLTSVTIPESVTSIDTYAFSYCSRLTKAEFASIKSLCSIKFGNDGNPLIWANNLYIDGKEIKEVEIPESVTSIGNYTFSGCSRLTSITIPESVTSIGNRAFYCCSSLTSVTIPNSVTSIGDDAFYRCSSLTSVTIPNSVTSIGDNAFYDCSSLKKSAYPKTLENPFTDGVAIAYNPNEALVENGFVYNSDKSEIRFAPYEQSGEYNVPDGVLTIGENAYQYCDNMTSIVIPDNVTAINEGAFKDCTALKDVTLPLRLESLGAAAFDGSTAIENVVFRGPTPVEAPADVFDSSVYESATLYVRPNRVILFQTVSPWKFFFNITDKELSGIEEIMDENIDANEPYEVYNLNGVCVGTSMENLAPGIYIIRQGAKTQKTMVK